MTAADERPPRVRTAVTAGVATALGALPLGAVFAEGRWLAPVLGAVAAVTGASVLARRLRLPLRWSPFVTTVAAVGYLTAVFAPGTGRLGVLPTGRTLDVLRGVAGAGLRDVQALAAPVPARPGVVLLVVTGVAAVAIGVDALAVALGLTAPAGLLLLALFVVPVVIAPGGVGVIPFAFAAAGYLGLLLAGEWERLGRWAGPTKSTHRPRARLGRRLGVAAVAPGLAVPTVLPTADGGVLGNRPGGEAGPNSITTYNPIVGLRGQLTRPTGVELLRVTTNDPEPDYLRLTALDRFDGESWAVATLSAPATQRVGRGLPPPPGLSPATPTRTVSASIAVQQLSVSWLPVPYAPRSVAVDGDWRYDDQSRTVFSTHADSRGLGYRVTATRPAPTPQQLRADLPIEPALARYLEVPPNLPAQVRTIVHRVTADAATRAEKAAALQAYFRGPLFAYSLQVPPGISTDALLNFLQVRRGYCEQFAAAMALLARVAGIPSRVAIGFTPGRRVAPSAYSVTTADAHAWPELYFPGAGWLRYEPTPSSDGRALVPGYTLPAATSTPDSASAAAPAVDPATPRGRTGALRTAHPAERRTAREGRPSRTGRRGSRSFSGWPGRAPCSCCSRRPRCSAW